MENRRNDKRLLIPDLQIRVKKHAAGGNASYVDCTPIDISFNGLAFSSSQLSLGLLQKIDIQLSVGRRILEGSAVVCHVAETKNAVRYGILYIDIKPSLEELFSLKTLSCAQIQELAISLADNALIDIGLDDNQQSLKKAQMLLFDGVEAFKTRLCQRMKNKIDNQGKPYQLADLFEFDADMLSVTVPMKSVDGLSVIRATITPILDGSNNHVVFEINNSRRFSTLVELLQELGETFTLLLAKG